MGYRLEIKHHNSDYAFSYFLIYIIFFCNYSIAKNIKLSFNNNDSWIKIKFLDNGQNRYLSSSFSYKPSLVEFNHPTNCDYISTCNVYGQKKTISLKFTDININSCENMFKGLINIQEIDLSEFDSSQVISMAHMFEGCSNLKKINFGNMDTSNVKNMEYLFYGCSELENLDLSNFDTSLVINMRYMFALLFDLKYLELSENFKTSNVVNMAYMFYYTHF